MTTTYVYIIRSDRNAYYVGMTKNIVERINQHICGRGSVQTSSMDIVELTLVIKCETRQEAQELEYSIQSIQLEGKLDDFITAMLIENPFKPIQINDWLRHRHDNGRNRVLTDDAKYCKRGHLWSENTYVILATGSRRCKECHRERTRNSYRNSKTTYAERKEKRFAKMRAAQSIMPTTS